jgi:hypothetical protein
MDAVTLVGRQNINIYLFLSRHKIISFFFFAIYCTDSECVHIPQFSIPNR